MVSSGEHTISSSSEKEVAHPLSSDAGYVLLLTLVKEVFLFLLLISLVYRFEKGSD